MDRKTALGVAYDQIHLAETDVWLLREEKLDKSNPAQAPLHMAHSHLLDALDAMFEALQEEKKEPA